MKLHNERDGGKTLKVNKTMDARLQKHKTEVKLQNKEDGGKTPNGRWRQNSKERK